MSKTRTETDTFGPIEVAADRYWGAQTQRSLQNFRIGGERMPAPVVHALGVVKSAAALANMGLGQLDSETGRHRSRPAAQEVIDGKLDDHFPLVVWQTGSGTQSNMNANEVISNRGNRNAGRRNGLEEAGSSQRSRQSRPVVERQFSDGDAYRGGDGDPPAADARARAICTARLRAKEKEFADIIKIGRTHLQDATPHHARPGIFRLCHADRLWHRARRSGAAAALHAGAGRHRGRHRAQRRQRASPSASPRKPPKMTGLPFVTAPNKFEALAAHDAMVEMSGALNTLAVSLYEDRARISACWDQGRVRGLGEIEPAGKRARLVDHAGQGQSDAMRSADHGVRAGDGQSRRRSASPAARAISNSTFSSP